MHDALRQLEEMAGASKPPPLVALYRGSPAERKQLLVELEPRLQERGLTVLAFNARRHLSEPDLGGPLAQRLLLLLQELSEGDSTALEITGRLLDGLDELMSQEQRGTARMVAMREFDTAMRKLLKRLVTQPPLVVLVQGVNMTTSGALLRLLEFMAGFLDLPGCMFVLALGERALKADLQAQYGDRMPYSPQEFLTETFHQLVLLGDSTTQPKAGGDPALQAKRDGIGRLAPAFHTLLESEPVLLTTLERLVRGDSSPELLKQIGVNTVALDAYNNGNLRALLAKPPFFDPQPVTSAMGARGSSVVTLNEEPQFKMPSRLESESGGDIAKQRRQESEPHADPQPKMRKAKVRKAKAAPKRRARKHTPTPKAEPEGVTLEILMEPVLSGDYIAARELWSKVPDADPVLLEDAVKEYVIATRDSKSRVRASAAAALGTMASFAPVEMPDDAMDMLLILTSDAVETVKDAAAEAIKQFKGGGEPAFEYGGDASVPEFKPVSTGSSTVREASADLPTFTPVDESQPENTGPSFESAGINEAPVFKPVDKQPSFKVVEDEKPQFKPVAKQPSFKIVE
ncbi:MAG: hypothetical protein QF392_03305 [Candidatus Poseidoniia archaeon]|nr:hypothetical protein [Gammaproteobacteria bacterium]MDP6835179.1 hypothetical protein [Candidatus Poseidoniia archaeon]